MWGISPSVSTLFYGAFRDCDTDKYLDLSEEQIIAILSQAGQVVKFRLMTNPDTGKPKGFGFADYADADSAASAVRNLNDYEVNGRKIRVDWPHNNEKDSVPQNYDQTTAAPVDNSMNGQPAQNALPPLPPGVELPPNLKATDAISQTLSALPPQTLLDVLTQMKSLAISEPARATELLRQQPQLSYAIFQALILMNLVDHKILTQVIEQPQARPPPIVNQPPQVMQHQQPPHGFPPPPQQYAGYPPQNMARHPAYGLPPPPQHTPVPPPVQPQPAQLDQHQLLQQILNMDQRTIDSLPQTERQQVIYLRQQHGVR